MEPSSLSEKNQQLAEISAIIFGDSARLQIVDPKNLQLLKENARYFKKDTFRQLTENIRSDKRLSSVPLCHETLSGLEVLSGNHRVQAAVAADLPLILVIVITGELPKNKKIAVQLSHNSLVGQDDLQILANLWSQLDDIAEKCYAGLSDATIGDIDKIPV